MIKLNQEDKMKRMSGKIRNKNKKTSVETEVFH
jgi:hypothetical protein